MTPRLAANGAPQAAATPAVGRPPSASGRRRKDTTTTPLPRRLGRFVAPFSQLAQASGRTGSRYLKPNLRGLRERYPGHESRREAVLAAVRANPCRPYTDIAAEIGLTKQRVHQIVVKAGLPTPGMGPRRVPRRACLHCGEPLGLRPKRPLHMRCSRTYNTIEVECSRCGRLHRRYKSDVLHTANDPRYSGKMFCPDCWGAVPVPCSGCGDMYQPSDSVRCFYRQGKTVWCPKPECRAKMHAYITKIRITAIATRSRRLRTPTA